LSSLTFPNNQILNESITSSREPDNQLQSALQLFVQELYKYVSWATNEAKKKKFLQNQNIFKSFGRKWTSVAEC
jgi:hypothetical protein